MRLRMGNANRNSTCHGSTGLLVGCLSILATCVGCAKFDLGKQAPESGDNEPASGNEQSNGAGGGTTDGGAGNNTSGAGNNTSGAGNNTSGAGTTGSGSASGNATTSGNAGSDSATTTGSGTTANGSATSGTTDGGSGEPIESATFPIRVSPNKKYLLDKGDQPFLLVGDAAWSLITQLSKDDAIAYLDDRQSRGFNAVCAELIEHRFTSHSPAWLNAEQEAPFSNVNDFTTVNDAYFEHAAWVLQQASDRGILVFLTGAYIGYECGNEGWCKEMTANGPDKLTAYGEYIGQYFKRFPNIVWVQGGDLVPSTNGSPSQMDLVNAVGNGVKTGDGGTHLHTAHWARGFSSGEVNNHDWLDIDATYASTPRESYKDSLADWGRDEGVRPMFFFEGRYEAGAQTTGVELRAQMYQPMLAGSAGFMFGNGPMWFFGEPGDGNPGWSFHTESPVSWKSLLSSPGAGYVLQARALFESMAWYDLVPDVEHRILTGGYAGGTSTDNGQLASTPDGRLAVAYFTASLTARIDLARFAGSVSVNWYDPTTGTSTPATGSPFSNAGSQDFAPPGSNAAGDRDWVLLLTSD